MSGYTRGYGRLIVHSTQRGALVPSRGASVRLFLPGTNTPYPGSLYGTADSAEVLSWPQLTDDQGTLALQSALAALTTRVATLEAQLPAHTHTSGTVDVMGGTAIIP